VVEAKLVPARIVITLPELTPLIYRVEVIFEARVFVIETCTYVRVPATGVEVETRASVVLSNIQVPK
jgi:hypothetical protein